MGLATIDPHSQKEHTKIHKIPKFGVTETRTFVRICPLFTLLNACISVKTFPINTKLGDFVNLGVLFLTMWINSC